MTKWYFVNKENGKIVPAAYHMVATAAKNNHGMPQQEIANGRFQTPFAIYTNEANLTAEEREQVAAWLAPQL